MAGGGDGREATGAGEDVVMEDGEEREEVEEEGEEGDQEEWYRDALKAAPLDSELFFEYAVFLQVHLPVRHFVLVSHRFC
jgi:hypothetical protein